MNAQTRTSRRKQYGSSFLSVLIFLILSVSGKKVLSQEFQTEDYLVLEPVVQGYVIDDFVQAYREKGIYFLPLYQLSRLIGFNLQEKEVFSGYMFSPDNTFEIDLQKLEAKTTTNKTIKLTPTSFKELDFQVYLDKSVYEQIFPISIDINEQDMRFSVESSEKLPITIKAESQSRRKLGVTRPTRESFKDYTFDERLFTVPVLDLFFGKNFSMTNAGKSNRKTWNGEDYAADIGFLFSGLDTRVHVFGNSEVDNNKPRMRLTMGRTFLEEPGNIFNLTSFKAGDISGFNSTLFSRARSGRGLYLSSFKDLVMSADKTIDLNGPLSPGWEVELYLNEQLIGFRQGGQAGQYDFPSIPVSYGLNVFKLVFYGPFGEIRTEERKFYSGTSPVKKGEIGYTFNALQPDRYLLESNEPITSDSNKPMIDVTTYYGLTDFLTAIAGYAMTQDQLDDHKSRSFAMAGLQAIFKGASFQYNTMYDPENNVVGHHGEVQGNVYIGDIFARYDYFGDLESPISYVHGRYLEQQFEGRLTGFIPYARLPYYLAYRLDQDHDNETNQIVTARLSPNLFGRLNMSIENVWQSNDITMGEETNDVAFLLHFQYGKFGAHAEARYRTHPNHFMRNLAARVDYRWDKNTYFQAEWRHDYRSKYDPTEDDLDTIGLSAARLFPFGGITLSASLSSDRDLRAMIGYNISFGLKPNSNRPFVDAKTKLSERAAISVKTEDQQGKPVPDIEMFVNGLQKPVQVNKKGEAVITDVEAYQMVNIEVDRESVGDVTIYPMEERYRLVLRPGTVLPLDVKFVQRGAIEGVIRQTGKEQRLIGYRAIAKDKDGKIIGETYTDRDGFFVLDGLAFGTYTVALEDPSGAAIYEHKPIALAESQYVIDKDIVVPQKTIYARGLKAPDFVFEPPAPPAAKPKIVRTAAPTTGDVYVQFFAGITEASADRYWSIIKRRMPELEKYPRIIRIRGFMNEDEELYRLQSGPFKQEDAEALCRRAKTHQVDCFVVR